VLTIQENNRNTDGLSLEDIVLMLENRVSRKWSIFSNILHILKLRDPDSVVRYLTHNVKVCIRFSQLLINTG